MAIIVEFIKNYGPWMYGACALVALWYLRIAILARRDRRSATFSLEREAALNRTYSAWSVAFALILIMGSVYFLSTVVANAVRPLVLGDSTPTPMALTRLAPTPTAPLPEATVEAQASPTPAVTRTARPTARLLPTATQAPAPSPRPQAAAAQGPGCPDRRAVITSPGVGAEVSGMVPIFGTAQHENFKYYKLEFGAGNNPSVWSYFAGGEHAVAGGQLGALNAGALAPGVYSIRVVVVDASGNFPEPCQTTVTVKG